MHFHGGPKKNGCPAGEGEGGPAGTFESCFDTVPHVAWTADALSEEGEGAPRMTSGWAVRAPPKGQVLHPLGSPGMQPLPLRASDRALCSRDCSSCELRLRAAPASSQRRGLAGQFLWEEILSSVLGTTGEGPAVSG